MDEIAAGLAVNQTLQHVIFISTKSVSEIYVSLAAAVHLQCNEKYQCGGNFSRIGAKHHVEELDISSLLRLFFNLP